MQDGSSSSVRVFYPGRSRREVVHRLRERLDRLADSLPVVRAVLFGSYARGEFTVASDVDLLVIYEGEPREDAFETVKRVVDVRGVEPHVYSRREYEAQRETVDRMTRDGVELLDG